MIVADPSQQHDGDPRSPQTPTPPEPASEDAYEGFIMESIETRYWPDHLLMKYNVT